MFPKPPVTVTSKSGFITPPSHISCGLLLIDVISGSSTIVIVIGADIWLEHPAEEKVRTQ